jgi:hypothetical protein
LEQKHSSLLKENSGILDEFRSNCSSGESVAAVEKDYATRLNLLRAKLAAAERLICDSRGECSKQRERFAAEMNQLEKGKRFFERQRKAEVQAIDETYERNIQIEQVRVQHALENLTKLYNEDENARGREILETARKVSDVLNQTTHQLARGRHELDSFLRQTQVLRTQIHELSTARMEIEIAAQIQGSKMDSVRKKGQIEMLRLDNVQALAKQMPEQNAIDSEAIRALQTVEASALAAHAEKMDVYRAECLKIRSDLQNEIGRLQAEFDKRRAKSTTEHNSAVEHIKRKIDMAKRQKYDLLAKVAAETAGQRQQQTAELAARVQENTRKDTELFSEERVKSDQLSDQIAQLSSRIQEAKLRHSAPEQRPADRKTMDGLLSRIRSFDDIIRSTFTGMISAIQNAPMRVPDTDSPSSPTPVTPTSRNSHRDSSRVVTPIESKYRRRRSGAASAAFL